jgi:hypothetical protein
MRVSRKLVQSPSENDRMFHNETSLKHASCGNDAQVLENTGQGVRAAVGTPFAY